MAKNETPQNPPVASSGRPGRLAALKAISDYKPANDAFNVANIQTVQDAMVAKRDIEAQKQADLDTARDDAAAAEWNFHNALLGAKEQVRAQYGIDSNQVQALGAQRRSPCKSPGPQDAPPTPKP